MRVEFKTLIDSPEEYKITLKIIDGGREYQENYISDLSALKHQDNKQREKDWAVSKAILHIMEGMVEYKKQNNQ
jgi:hypothetical protein